VRLLTHAQFKVTVPLADNVFPTEAPADRSIVVWRGVPSLANADLTAPYGVDGRFESRQIQAAAAIQDHMAPTTLPRDRDLDSIAAFVGQFFYPLRLRSLLPSSGDTLPLDPDFSHPSRRHGGHPGKGRLRRELRPVPQRRAAEPPRSTITSRCSARSRSASSTAPACRSSTSASGRPTAR
jgi:hypothetical protein